jgi:hypothetical protein
MALPSMVLLLLAFAPGREVSAPLTGPNPGVTSVLETVARPDGGFFVTWYDGRSFSSGVEDFVP